MSYGSKFDMVEVAQIFRVLSKINPYFRQIQDVEALLFQLECLSRSEGMSGERATYLRTFGLIMTPYCFTGDRNDIRYKLSIDVSLLSDYLS